MKPLGKVRDFIRVFDSRLRGFEDYFEFPFDISRPMPPSAAQELCRLGAYLNLSDLDYRVADGTLLGIYRDQTLIKHDTDLDIYFSDENSLKLAVEFLLNSGYQVGRKLSKGKLILQYSLYGQDNLLVDFLMWHKLDPLNHYWEGPEIRKRRIQPRENFENFSYIAFRGIELKTFADIPGWLESIYGKKWSVPEQKKNDWRIGIGDLEL
jgi:hypothetical protein